MEESWIGRVIGGCEIRREIDHSSTAAVYLAHRLSTGREVALKVMDSGLLADPSFMERFRRETEAAAALNHRNVISIYDSGRDGACPYLMMAYLPGGTVLDQLLRGALPLALALRIAGDVSAALDHAHRNNVIHRDVRPANVLLNARHKAVLTDFGLSHVLAETRIPGKQIPLTPPSYLPPEAIVNGARIGPAADIYGLAVMVYHMLTGEPPFPHATPVQAMWAHASEPAPPVSVRRPGLPPAFDAVLQRALSKSPDNRYPTAGKLIKALADASDPPEQLTLPPTAGEQLHEVVRHTIDQVVRIERPDGSVGAGLYLPDGQVITCLHIIDGARQIDVAFRTGEHIAATMTAAHRGLDLALLQLDDRPRSLDPDRLAAIRLDAANPAPGTLLTAITHTHTLGWVPIYRRVVGRTDSASGPLGSLRSGRTAPRLEVDETFHAGASGGVLVDAENRFAGLASTILLPHLTGGYGCAVAADACLVFWKAHSPQAEADPWVAYTCGHHHLPGSTTCPLTGKPASPRPTLYTPPPGPIAYSCGHMHPRRLSVCPLTGGAVLNVDKRPSGRPDVAVITCTNCGYDYPRFESACPICDKPHLDL